MTEYFGWGLVEVHIEARGGRIEQARIFSDALFSDWVEVTEQSLVGQTFNHEGITTAIAQASAALPALANELSELGQWLKREAEV